MRTKWPKNTVKIRTKCQQKEFDRKIELAVACNPNQQKIIFRGQEMMNDMLIFHNFFVHDGVWCGYVFYICRNGAVTVDKNYRVVEVCSELALVKHERNLPIEVSDGQSISK